MSALLAHAQRSKPVDFVGIALIAYMTFKENLVLLILPLARHRSARILPVDRH
jgi:hypothetical protein